jgi:WD40 repeat protein
MVRIYESLNSGKLIQTLKSHTDIVRRRISHSQVFSVDFHPLNQSLLASCSGKKED